MIHERNWYRDIDEGFWRAELYYRHMSNAGKISIKREFVAIEQYGHEFMTAMVDIANEAQQLIEESVFHQGKDIYVELAKATIKDFICYFIENNAYSTQKFAEVFNKPVPAKDSVLDSSNLYKYSFLSFFRNLAIKRFYHSEVTVVDFEERLNDYIKLLKGEFSGRELIRRISSNTNIETEYDRKINELITLSYNHGRIAGVEENKIGFAGLGRQQNSDNADLQAKELAPIIRELVQEGAATLQNIANQLNQRGILTKNANSWYPANVKMLIERINTLFPDNPIPSPKDSYIEKIRPIVEQIRNDGVNSLAGIANALNAQGVMSQHGKQWYTSSVKDLLERIDGRKEELQH